MSAITRSAISSRRLGIPALSPKPTPGSGDHERAATDDLARDGVASAWRGDATRRRAARCRSWLQVVETARSSGRPRTDLDALHRASRLTAAARMHLPGPHTRAKAGFSPWEGKIARDADSPLEQSGLALVPVGGQSS